MSASAASSSSSSSFALAHEAVRLVMTNRFHDAAAFFELHRDDPRVSLLSSFMAYLNAISSHAEDDLNEGLRSVWASEANARKHLVSSPQLAESIEGELIQADSHMLASMIQFVQQSWLKVAWNIRKSFNFYTHVEERLQQAEEGGQLSGVQLAERKGWMQFGVGMFQLMLSLLPPSVMKMAEWVGYAGDRERAFEYLHQSQQSPSFMAPFSALLLLSYYLTISTFTGQEDPAYLSRARTLLDWAAVHYPNGAFFALMESRYFRTRVEPRRAIEAAQAGLLRIRELPSISIMFHYQSGWCALFLLEWAESARYFDALLHSQLGGEYGPPATAKKAELQGKAEGEEEEKQTGDVAVDQGRAAVNGHQDEEEEEELSIPPTKASAQALYAYQCGLCYAMQGDLDRARWYLQGVPGWLTAKNKNIDLFAVHKAHEMLHRPQLREAELALDVIELLHCWNGLIQTPPPSLQQLRAMMQRTGQAMQAGPSPTSPPFTREDLVRYLFYTAVLTGLTDPAAAHQQIEQLLHEHERYIERSEYAKRSGLLVFVYLELATDCLHANDLAGAKKAADRAKSFKNYPLHDVAQLKLHAFSQKMKRKEDQDGE